MAITANRHIYHQLAECCTIHMYLDDPLFNLKQMFQNISLQFNDERVFVKFPPNFYDVGDTNGIDANDITRVRITRDFK